MQLRTEGAWWRRPARNGPLVKQLGGELARAIPRTQADDASISTYAKPERCYSCLRFRLAQFNKRRNVPSSLSSNSSYVAALTEWCGL